MEREEEGDTRAGPERDLVEDYLARFAKAGRNLGLALGEPVYVTHIDAETNVVTVGPREALLRQVWGHEEFVDARTVDVHVRRVRAKLATIAPDAQIILTEWGVGYKLVMN